MQTSYIVSRTDLLYPDLWVVDGLGASLGMADFVTVPIYWFNLHWEPNEKSAKTFRTMVGGQGLVVGVGAAPGGRPVLGGYVVPQPR